MESFSSFALESLQDLMRFSVTIMTRSLIVNGVCVSTICKAVLERIIKLILKILLLLRCLDCLAKICVNMDGKQEGIDLKVLYLSVYVGFIYFLTQLIRL